MADRAEETKNAAEELGTAEKADILFYNGEITRAADYKFIETVINRKRRERVILVLVTPGGDADAAYRICRCLQDQYKHFTLFVPGWCKSAGTLLAIGAHRIVMSEYGEMGPLDVQLGKRDELFEYGSGLDIDAAIKQLESLSFGMFEDVMLAIEHSSDGRITFKTASELSYEMVTRLFGNLYAQIDPIEIGKTTRLMTIANDYGERLAEKAQNFKRENALDLLVSSYSSHGFVIDFGEAETIFKNVEKANPAFARLQEMLGGRALYPIEKTQARSYVMGYLNEEVPDAPAPDIPPDGQPEPAPPPPGNGPNPDGGGHHGQDFGPADAAQDFAPIGP